MEKSVFCIAVCDDDALYLDIMEKRITKYILNSDETIIIKRFGSGNELCAYCRGNEVHLAFLDIEMDDGTGIDAASFIRNEQQNHEMQIVFVTAKDGYDRQLFDFQPMGFIDKWRTPLKQNMQEEEMYNIIANYINLALRKHHWLEERFQYTKNYEWRVLQYKDIISFEKKGKNIVIHIKNQTEDMFRGTLKDVEAQLNHIWFVKVNQSVIININYADVLKRDKVIMRGGEIYDISRRCQRDVLHKLMD